MAPTPRLARQFRALQRHPAQDHDFPFQDLIPQERLATLLREAGAVWRDCLFTPVVTFWTFLWQVLGPDRGCQAAVARLLAWRTARGQKPCSTHTDPYCKARRRLPEPALQRLMQHAGQDLHRSCLDAWRWCGRTVKLVDGTTVSMPDTPANQAEYPQQAAQAAGLGFPIARMVVLFCLATGAVLEAAVGPYKGKGTGEIALFRSLHDHLKPGDVVLGDRYYGSYLDLALLRGRGVDGVFRLHQGRRCDFRRGRRLGREDHLVIWRRPARPGWMDAETYEQIPAEMEVRELRVPVRQRGFRTRTLVIVTTLLDTEIYTKQDLAALYRQRWHAELDLRSIKVVLGMDVLRCKTPEMVRKEIWMHLLAYNLIRTLMARAAEAQAVGPRPVSSTGVEPAIGPRQVSFAGALQLVVAFAGTMRTSSVEARRHFEEVLLGAIASLRVGDRPDRNEPRARKRRPKPYPLLRQPRRTARRGLRRAG